MNCANSVKINTVLKISHFSDWHLKHKFSYKRIFWIQQVKNDHFLVTFELLQMLFQNSALLIHPIM